MQTLAAGAIAPSSIIAKPSVPKLREQVLSALPLIALLCGLLPAPAQSQFAQQGPKLVGTSGIGPQGSQGYSVALSGDGSTAILGGPGDNGGVGAAWVFTRSAGVWGQQAKLSGTVIAAGAAGQGSSVSISRDGNTAIVARPGDATAPRQDCLLLNMPALPGHTSGQVIYRGCAS